MMTTSRRPKATSRCYACAGRYSFDVRDEKPVAFHSLPFCPAFNAIQTLIDALRHAELSHLDVKTE